MLQAPAPLRQLTCIWDHTVLPATRQRRHSRLYPSQLKPELDLTPPPQGCKAELRTNKRCCFIQLSTIHLHARVPAAVDDDGDGDGELVSSPCDVSAALRDSDCQNGAASTASFVVAIRLQQSRLDVLLRRQRTHHSPCSRNFLGSPFLRFLVSPTLRGFPSFSF